MPHTAAIGGVGDAIVPVLHSQTRPPSRKCYRVGLALSRARWCKVTFLGMEESIVEHAPNLLSTCSEKRSFSSRINGVVVTWVVAIDPPGVRFPLNAEKQIFLNVWPYLSMLLVSCHCFMDPLLICHLTCTFFINDIKL